MTDTVDRRGAQAEMPPEDRDLSPDTGYGREHWARVADNLLLSVRPFRSPDGGQIDLPGRPARAGQRSDGLEGFARTFLLAAIRVAGDDGADGYGFLSDYLAGVIAGTRGTARGDDPIPGETWQPIGDTGAGGQPMVESASIALALHLTRRWTWERLDAVQRDDLEAWLREALRHEPAPNNWYLFPLTVANFLESVGRRDAETDAAIDRALGLLEAWYRGDGWYSDGDGRAFDHHIGWALHFYPVLFADLRRGQPDDRFAALAGAFGDRLHTFLESFTLTFDRNGSPLYLGRSLTYRTAALASVGLAEVAGCSPLRPGQSRRLMSQTLRYFLDHGAVTADGLLSLGWHGPHDATLQPYSGPGSPYWASKGFVALLLPPEHSFWTAREERLDGDAANTVRAIPSVGWLIQRTGRDGIARVHNHGSDHLAAGAADAGQPDPLYARFAYSTRTGPTALRNLSDNDVQLTVRGVTSVRRSIRPLGSGPDWAASSHTPRFPTPTAISGGGAEGTGPQLPSSRIESLVIVRGCWEVRVNRFVGVPSGTPARLSGWALAAASPERLRAGLSPEGTGVTIHAPDLVSELVGVRGWEAAETGRAPQGTAYGSWALVPAVTGTVRPGLFVAFARLSAADDTEPPSARASVNGLDIRWADGSHTLTWTDLRPSVTWRDRAAEADTP